MKTQRTLKRIAVPLLMLLAAQPALTQVGPGAAYFEIDGDYGSVFSYQAPIHANYLPALKITDGDGANQHPTYAPKEGVRIDNTNEPACTDWYHISSPTYMGPQAYRVQAIFDSNEPNDKNPRRSEQMLLNEWYTGTDSARYFTLAFRFNTIGALDQGSGYIAQWHHGGSGQPAARLLWGYQPEDDSYYLEVGLYRDSAIDNRIFTQFFKQAALPDVWHRMLFRLDPGVGWGRSGCEDCPGSDGSVSVWMMNPQTSEWEPWGEEYHGQLGHHYLWDEDGNRIGNRTGDQLAYQWKVGHYVNETDWISLDYDNVAYGKRWNNITKNRLIGYHKSVLNLKFDEGSGTVANDDCWSWNGGAQGDATMDYDNDGSLVGNVARSTDGIGFYRRSLLFNGGYVSIPIDTTDFDFGNYVTVSAWFKTTASAAQSQGLLSIDADDGLGKVFLYRTDTRLAFGVRHPDGTYSQVAINSHLPGLYADGQWHHVVGTFNRFAADNRRAKLYVDGLRVVEHAGYDKPILRGDTRLVVARLGNSGGFIGNIDEVNILNYTMTDADVAALMAQSTVPVTRIWDGGSPSVGTWTGDANWQGNVQPASGDFLIFPAGAARLTNTNTFGAGTVFSGILFQGDNYNIYGNAVTITDQITAEAGATGNTFRPDIQLGAQGYFRAQGSGLQLTFLGDIDLNGHDLILVCQPGQLVCGGVISGAGDVFKSGSGSAVFSGISGNTYNGTTYVVDGFLQLSKYVLINPGAVRLGRIAVPGNLVIGTIISPLISDAVVCNANNQVAANAQVTVNPTGELNLNDYNNTVSFLHVAGGHVTSGNGTLTVTSNIVCDTADDGSALSGKLNLGPNGSNVILNDDANLTIYAVVGGAASAPLQVSGSGELRLTANNTYAGPTTINGGRLLVNGTQTNSAVTLSGGTLGGIGTIGPLTANSGHLAPGTSAGRLRVGGNTALGTAATFLVELNGLAAGISYDQLVVNGSVNLAGAVLDGSIGFVSTPGNAFTILVNEGTDSIQGTFAGLAQGTVFALGGEYFSIRYDGGTGNDIVLTRVNRPALLSGPVRLNSGQFQFEGFGEASLSYLIQANTNPGTTNWFTLGSAVANGAGLFQFLDTNALLFPQRFYRAVAP